MNEPVVWDDVAALARAVVALTGDADLTHDLLVELAAPIVIRMASLTDALCMDPNGDSEKELVAIHRNHFRQLQCAEIELEALHGCGVDNWDGYSDAMADAKLMKDPNY